MLMPGNGCRKRRTDRECACAGIIERLTVCRAGHFSCPVLAGVIFLAHFDGDASRTPQETFRALQVSFHAPCMVFSPNTHVVLIGVIFLAQFLGDADHSPSGNLPGPAAQHLCTLHGSESKKNSA